jgi:4-hydroxy-2-oxoheptanedioate aldolase
MIETQQALDNLDAILNVKGLDGIYVGPSDLAFSMGKTPRLDHEDPDILKIYQRLIAECSKRGIYAGIHCGSADYSARMIRMGFRLATVANDSSLMAKAAMEAVAGVWKDVGSLR